MNQSEMYFTEGLPRRKVGRTIAECEECKRTKEIMSRGLCDNCRKKRDAVNDAQTQEVPAAKRRNAAAKTTKQLYELLVILQKLGFSDEEIDYIFFDMAQKHVNVRPIRRALALITSVKDDDEYGDEDEEEGVSGSGSEMDSTST